MEHGFDIFFEEPGTVKKRRCRVCGTKCEVRRNVYGPTSFASALAKKYTYHDEFSCPHGEKEWHIVATELVSAIYVIPVRYMIRLIRQGLKDLLMSKLSRKQR